MTRVTEKTKQAKREERKQTRSSVALKKVQKSFFVDGNRIRMRICNSLTTRTRNSRGFNLIFFGFNAHVHRQKKYHKDGELSNYKGKCFALSVM